MSTLLKIVASFRSYYQNRKNDTLDETSHLVYWYGAREESNFYGFCAKDIVPYDEGLQRGFYKPYEAVKAKVAENKKLTKGEQDKLLAINEVREDLRKKPKDRRRGYVPFPFLLKLADSAVVFLQFDSPAPCCLVSSTFQKSMI
jgi:hypothetical protein